MVLLKFIKLMLVIALLVDLSLTLSVGGGGGGVILNPICRGGGGGGG